MRAELRKMHSPDAVDLRGWAPSRDTPAILLQLMVGPEGEPGEESFEVTLCTAEWLEHRAKAERIVDCRHHFVIDDCDYDEIEQYFRRRVADCQGATWPEVAAKVSELGGWEFEGYAG